VVFESNLKGKLDVSKHKIPQKILILKGDLTIHGKTKPVSVIIKVVSKTG
jgi:polyisoprenoid-binding protein YceI